MKTIKVLEATGTALDWAVAKVEGYIDDSSSWLYEATVADVADSDNYRPSIKWAQGGPIIEREKIQINPSISSDAWGAANPSKDQCVWVWAETPLIAAMRCYVATKLGNTIKVPEEFV